MFIEYDPEEDGPIIESKVMLFGPNERLMCPACGIVSNNHLHSDLFFYHFKFSPFNRPQLVCYHTCHRCGYKDDGDWDFTDIANWDCDETRSIQEWEEELLELEEEVSILKEKIKRGKARWDELWGTDEDVT